MCDAIIGRSDENQVKNDITHTYCDNCLKEQLETKCEEEEVGVFTLHESNKS